MNTTYWLNTIAGNIFNAQTDPPLPKKFYFGVSKTYPSEDQSNVSEPVGGGYQRVELTSLKLSGTGAVVNGGSIQMPESTQSWGVMNAWCVFDSPSGGKLLVYDYFRNPETDKPETRTVDAGTVLHLRPETVTLYVKNDRTE